MCAPSDSSIVFRNSRNELHSCYSERKGVTVMARVQFDHVYKRFGKVEVVHDITLDIKDKEFLVLVGPSGCGKTQASRGTRS